GAGAAGRPVSDTGHSVSPVAPLRNCRTACWDAPYSGRMTQTPMDRALVEEATRKSALIWVRGTEGAPRPLWHVWHEGAVWLVGDGPGEQPLQGLGLTDGGPATVTVRSKDKGGRLVSWTARVGEPEARGEEWLAGVEELKGKRLNAPDAEAIADRWARE